MYKFSIEDIVALVIVSFAATIVIAVACVIVYKFFPYSIIVLASLAVVFVIVFRLIAKAVIKADERDRERFGL